MLNKLYGVEFWFAKIRKGIPTMLIMKPEKCVITLKNSSDLIFIKNF